MTQQPINAPEQPSQPVFTPPERRPAYEFVKRALDIVISSLMLVVFSPIMLITALAVVLDDPSGGPIFSQPRNGKDGKVFRMHKFRSMRVNAEALLDSVKSQNEMDGPVFKIKNDPRITRVGRIIRKTSLDELPQLINILKGEMTIVGPRPPLPREVAQYTPYQFQRLSVTPGLTCLWQIAPRRNDISFEQWVEMDLEYIRTRSVKLDLSILLRTVGAVFRHDGA